MVIWFAKHALRHVGNWEKQVVWLTVALGDAIDGSIRQGE